MTKINSLWVEAFRPTTLDKYLCDPELKERFQEFIDKNDIPHCIFAGSAGLGKSTLARLLVKNIKCDYLIINASDENGIETIREKVKSFASSASFQPLKVIILEEASFLTGPAQEALKDIIEEYSVTTRFIFTCNYLEKITAPIRSRCNGNIFTFSNTPKSLIAEHLSTNILDIEGIKYDIKDLVKLINYCYPDIRATIGLMQSCVKDGVFSWKEPDINWLNDIINILAKRDKKAWYEIRQIVANNPVDNFQSIYRYLFDNLDKFSHGHDAEISVILDDALWHSNMVFDKEINFAATTAKILETNKKIIL